MNRCGSWFEIFHMSSQDVRSWCQVKLLKRIGQASFLWRSQMPGQCLLSSLRSHKVRNVRAENSHLPLREPERSIWGFRSPSGPQRRKSCRSTPLETLNRRRPPASPQHHRTSERRRGRGCLNQRLLSQNHPRNITPTTQSRSFGKPARTKQSRPEIKSPRRRNHITSIRDAPVRGCCGSAVLSREWGCAARNGPCRRLQPLPAEPQFFPRTRGFR